MAGGVGSRFWPMSTSKYPKQFLDVLGIGKSLIQMTYERLLHIAPKENIFVVTNECYADIVQQQLTELTKNQILTEPIRKNTAPCIAYASAKIYALNPNATLIVAPSDHLILKEDKFVETVTIAIENANLDEKLVTLGIKPTRPDTGYGYIEFSDEKEIFPGQVTEVKHFREKPNKEMAELFLKSGNYYWNSGIFIWRAQSILNSLQKFKPDLFDLFAGDLSFYNTNQEQKKYKSLF